MRFRWSLLVFAALAACIVPARAAAALHPWTDPTTLRLVVTADPHGFNPIYPTNQEDDYLASLCFDLLITQDGAGRLVPDLAAEVPTVRNGGISADGKTIRYTLRHGVRWHDGAPFTSADVAFTWRAIMDARNAVPNRHGYDHVERVETPDPYTVVFHLKELYAPFVRTVFAEADTTYRVLPQHLLDHDASLDRADFNTHPIGTGPYKFVRWDRGQSVEYEANPAYFGGAPHIPKITVRIIPDFTTVAIELRTHHVDLGLLDSNGFTGLRGADGLVGELIPVNGFAAYLINRNHAPLDNVRVRRAIARAIDRASLARRVSLGTVLPGYADIPPALYGGSTRNDPNAYDPAAARALLDAAGWKPGPDGIRVRDGKRLAVLMVDYAGSPSVQNMDVQVQSMLRAVGIDGTIKDYAAATFFAAASAGGPLQGGNFDLALLGWLSGTDLDNEILFACASRPPHGRNFENYCSQEMDALQREALSTYDDAKRRAAYAKIEALILRDVPMAFVNYPRLRVERNADLHRPEPNFVTLWWHIAEWSFGP
ncbi:MAG TPA: peptide ABC transporter substrate-binding protein [Candidatus Elarobacter sp.]|nr:peptide ABC transporter substrate-binding protein [Candidatus Elarobacter sp.]